MYFGVDYYPEHWVFPQGGTAEKPEAAWERDVELMVRAGINVVRIGEFTWSLCEPEQGKFDFEWLKRLMDLLGTVGIQVVLATPLPPRPSGSPASIRKSCHWTNTAASNTRAPAAPPA